MTDAATEHPRPGATCPPPAAPRTLPEEHPLANGASTDSAVVRAFQGVRAATPPVWFMRQAGRSLPEYRRLREGTAMLDACLDPAMAAEITLQPVRRHAVDAAVFFSDIVIPLRLAGVDVDIVPGRGPVLAAPVRTAADVAALPEHPAALLDPENPAGPLAPVIEGVRRTVAELGGTPLVGFAGAPFTLAAYLVEGGPSKDHLAARTLMHADPPTWRRLMAWCADATGAFLRAQLLAGASAGQLFDSWAGSLSRADYAAHVASASARALAWGRGLAYAAIAPEPQRVFPFGTDVAGRTGTFVPNGNTRAAGAAGAAERTIPLVHFGVGTGELLADMHAVGADAVGVDYRTPLDEASRRLGGTVPVQGNIDPAMLAAPWPVLAEHVRDVLRRGRAAPAHVVNLGHGVPPTTDPDVLGRVVRLVHEEGAA